MFAEHGWTGSVGTVVQTLRAEERVAAGFARLVVTEGSEQTRIDPAADARLLPAEPSDLGLVLRAEELAVDKVLAIFGRAEARDFVDLASLEPL